MKRYKDYMDRVEVSDTLHQRLTELEAPKKRPAAWKKAGAVAAALVLIAGVGAWGLSRNQGDWDALMDKDNFRPNAGIDVADGSWAEIADAFEPDIVLTDPEPWPSGYVPEPSGGGYEVRFGEGPDSIVAYYFLPYIEYGMAENVSEMALDWDLPQGSARRDLTQADIAALFGGEKNLSDHLAWGDYELSGWAAWYEDGSLWGAFLNGSKGEQDHFEFAFVTGEQYPPTCIAYPDGVEQEIWDLTVTAWGYDSQNGYTRRVEFLHGGCGCRFDLTADHRELAEQLVNRLVRWVADEGLALDTLTSEGSVLAHPWEADPSYSVGEPRWEDGVPDEDSEAEDFYCDCPDCINGTVHTHPYDPSASN